MISAIELQEKQNRDNLLSSEGVVLSSLIPADSVDQSGQALELYKKAAYLGIQRALDTKVITSYASAQVTDALPNTDLGLTNEDWAATLPTSANNWAIQVNKLLPAGKLVVVWYVSIIDTRQQVTFVKFQGGSGGSYIKGQVATQFLYQENKMLGYLPKPVIYDQNETMYVQAYFNGIVGTPKVILGALLVTSANFKTKL